ncbi:hypothetical protein AB0J01_27940 [Streptomyces sp. NPDC050204]|uniref:hypothetical protein n=1 Tax=Streptomyces sp. NPDC050204 TaxID=3155514 RepID=UPI00343CDAC8
MRKFISGTVLVLAAALLTGCGSDDGPQAADKPASTSVKPKSDDQSRDVTHKVTLEVLGTGTSQVYYNLDTNKMQTVQLPWTKSSTITLTTDAEKRIGTTVSVVPGSVPTSDGTLRAATCVIKVDGKKVTDNQGGKSGKPCTYNVK